MLLCSCFYGKDLRLRQSLPCIHDPKNVGDDVFIDQAFEKFKSDLLCLNGSWFNRVEGLLRAFHNQGLLAELYGLAACNNFVALLSNTCSGADIKREVLLQRMSSSKTPIVQLSTPNCGGKQQVVAAALPLVHCGDLVGALWIGDASLQLPKGPPWRHVTSPASSRSSNASPQPTQQKELHPVTKNGTILHAAALLRSDESLRQLSFAASMCLASSGSDTLMWLTETVSRLQVAASMQALTAQLCAAVASHVCNHFMLEVSINVALVPPLTSGIRSTTKITTTTRTASDAGAGTDAPHAATTALLFRAQNNFDSGHVPTTDTSPAPTVPGGTNAALLISSRPVGGNAVSGTSAACNTLCTSGGCGPALTTSSVVVPLSAAEAAAVTAAAPGSTAALHADILPLQHTLLQAVLDELQKQRQQGQQKEQSAGGWGGNDVLPPGSGNGSTCSPISIIENTCLYVQNVHNPWRDVWLFMGQRRECIATPTGVSCFGSSLTTTMASGSSCRSSMPQSLALLTMPLDEGGAALGMYLCFPKRLPGALLEAVRVSCQELLSKGLSEQVRAKLEGTLSSEYDMLKAAAPGSYAVLRGVNTCEDRISGAVPNYTSSQMKHMGFLDILLRRKTVPSVTSQQSGSMLTLTTAFKTYALLGELDSGSHRGPSLTAVLSGVEDLDGYDKPRRSPAASNASARRRSLAIRRTPSESAARSPAATSATFANTTHDFTDFLLATCNGDVPDILGSGGGSKRAAGASATNGSGSGEAGGGNRYTLADGPFASIVTIASVDTQAHQRMDILMNSIQATVLESAASNSANCTFADDLEQLELTEVLGRGGGGVVFKGMMSGALPVAVKLMIAPGEAVEELGLSPEAVRRGMLRNAMELAVQSSLSHPNIVQLYATFRTVVLRARQPDTENCHLMNTDPRSLYLQDASGSMPTRPQHERKFVNNADEARLTCILAEYCDAGSLANALQSRAFPHFVCNRMAGMQPGSPAPFKYDLKGVLMTLLDVALALRHLHSLHLLHRDVKPANLLLKSNPRDPRGFTVKLGDFGFVLRLTETDEAGVRYANVDDPCGTVTHMAPECLSRKSKLYAAADIFSFGILMWELLAGGSRPFPTIQPEKILEAVYRGSRPKFSRDVPHFYQSLAMLCWRTEPARRPTARQLVTAITARLHSL